MEYVALDLETTGLDPSRDGVIEVGAVAFRDAEVTARLERFANPGRRIPEPVARLTGIRNDDLRAAPPPAAVLEELIRAAPTQWHLFQPLWPDDPGLGGRPG